MKDSLMMALPGVGYLGAEVHLAVTLRMLLQHFEREHEGFSDALEVDSSIHILPLAHVKLEGGAIWDEVEELLPRCEQFGKAHVHGFNLSACADHNIFALCINISVSVINGPQLGPRLLMPAQEVQSIQIFMILPRSEGCDADCRRGVRTRNGLRFIHLVLVGAQVRTH